MGTPFGAGAFVARHPDTRAQNQHLWTLVPIALSVFTLAALTALRLRGGGGEGGGLLASPVVALYQLFGFEPAFMGSLLMLAWSSIWFLTNHVDRPWPRVGKILGLAFCLAILVNLRTDGIAPTQGGWLGGFFAERLFSVFGYVMSSLVVTIAAIVMLFRATDSFFIRYFEGRAVGAHDDGVEAQAVNEFQTLRFQSPRTPPSRGPSAEAGPGVAVVTRVGERMTPSAPHSASVGVGAVRPRHGVQPVDPQPVDPQPVETASGPRRAADVEPGHGSAVGLPERRAERRRRRFGHAVEPEVAEVASVVAAEADDQVAEIATENDAPAGAVTLEPFDLGTLDEEVVEPAEGIRVLGEVRAAVRRRNDEDDDEDEDVVVDDDDDLIDDEDDDELEDEVEDEEDDDDLDDDEDFEDDFEEDDDDLEDEEDEDEDDDELDDDDDFEVGDDDEFDDRILDRVELAAPADTAPADTAPADTAPADTARVTPVPTTIAEHPRPDAAAVPRGALPVAEFIEVDSTEDEPEPAHDEPVLAHDEPVLEQGDPVLAHDEPVLIPRPSAWSSGGERSDVETSASASSGNEPAESELAEFAVAPVARTAPADDRDGASDDPSPRPADAASRQGALFDPITSDPGLLDEAAELVLEQRRASATFLRRRLRISNDDAVVLLGELARLGVIECEAGATQGRVIMELETWRGQPR